VEKIALAIASSVSSIAANVAIPALFTSTSTRPQAPSIASTHAVTLAASSTSSCTISTVNSSAATRSRRSVAAATSRTPAWT
jgi:hypothetical protein